VNGVHDMGGMHGLGPIQYERNEPVFHAQWEGRAFALNLAAALANELKATSDREYYESWLAALEHLATAKGLTDSAALLVRQEAWAEAYRHTPHGKPVELAAAYSKD
jgi:nitrile hydratase